jgi:hypothetical protein
VRRLAILALASTILALPVSTAAQEADQPTRVYVSYYQVNYGDLLEWMDLYRQDWEPLLAEMVADGRLLGYNALIHNTGGIYNFRLAMQGTRDTNFDRVGEDVLAQWTTRNPASFQRTLEMLRGHDDELWNIDQVRLTQGAEWQFMYDNSIQVPFEHWPTFTDTWNDALEDVLEQARSDGILSGWVVETHNTGGRFNWKVLLLFPTWDDISDLQGRLFEAVPLDHPLWSYLDAHKDEIWEQMPPAGGE